MNPGRILLLAEGDFEALRALLEEWNHPLIVASKAAALADWPPPSSDVVIVPDLEGSLPWVLEVHQLAPFPILGISWPHPDRWPIYQAGVDGCLGPPPWQEELQALLAHLPLWTGLAYQPAVALENMGHPSVVEQVVATFLAETPRLWAEVQAAYEANDRVKLAKAAHRFAGGVAIFGPIPTQRASVALEQAANSDAPVTPLYLVLRQALARLQATLQQA